MGAKQEMATSAKLQRAAAIGTEMEVILGDVGLQKLSKQAWLGMAAEMAGGADLEELRQRVEGEPYLNRLAGQVAARWARDRQDRPCPDPVFADGDNFGPAYSDRRMSGISVEQASAVVAVLVAEMLPAERWGNLSNFEQVPALLEPLRAELEQLDAELADVLRLRDLAWTADSRPELRAGPLGVAIVLDPGNVGSVASAIAAEAARDAARRVALAA